MRLAALYSGGKDSTFAMYLAEQMGHEITHLVNIMPDDDASWIFHTPNLNVVPVMAEAMNVPLVTARSTGTEEGDMEGLRNALSGLDVDGVVVGAVWSDYQWDRMNIILGDLNLVMIAPLWRKDQDLVLDELIDSGISAIIIGCFAGGLDEKWLGRKLDSDSAVELRKLRAQYGISVIGEGGEYESMTIDSPMNSAPIEIVESEKIWKKDSGTLSVSKAVLGKR